MSESAVVLVRVIPRAGRTEIAGRRGDAWVVRLAAAPVDGAANDALLSHLAKALNCARRDIAITAGEKNRDKRLRVSGMTAADVERRLNARSSAADGTRA